MANDTDINRLTLTADIVSAQIATGQFAADELPTLIRAIYGALLNVRVQGSRQDVTPAEPAVDIKQSVFPDYVICLEDGKRLRTLTRHLLTSHIMTPASYRAKWGLPPNYPMVAPSYAEVRSSMAKRIGLGQKREAPSEGATFERLPEQLTGTEEHASKQPTAPPASRTPTANSKSGGRPRRNVKSGKAVAKMRRQNSL